MEDDSDYYSLCKLNADKSLFLQDLRIIYPRGSQIYFGLLSYFQGKTYAVLFIVNLPDLSKQSFLHLQIFFFNHHNHYLHSFYQSIAPWMKLWEILLCPVN